MYFPFMLFIFFGITAILAAMFYLLHKQERLFRILRDENAELRVLLRAVGSRTDLSPPTADRQAFSSPVEDPLLNLSFEDPLKQKKTPERDPALELHFDTPLETMQSRN